MSNIVDLSTSVLTWLPLLKLFDQVRDAIRLKYYAYRTEQTYVQWIRRYILFRNKRHPNQMGVPEYRGVFKPIWRFRST